MRSINVIFSGESGTLIDWTHSVRDRQTVEQKYLMNIATEKESDPIFPDRGTDLLAQAIGGVVIDVASAQMIGTFAATDTIYFCSWEEAPSVYEADYYPTSAELIPTEYTNYGRTLNFELILTFRDGTTTETTTAISSNG